MEAVPSVCFIWPDGLRGSSAPTFTAWNPPDGDPGTTNGRGRAASCGIHDADKIGGIALCIGYRWYCGNWFRIWPSAAHRPHETTHDRQKVHGPWGAG